MAKKKSVLKMMDRFMEFHQKGYTIPDIARYFGLATRTVYLNLQDIADANGISRSELLQKPHKPHSPHKPGHHTTSESTSESTAKSKGFEELESMLKEAMVQVNTLLGIITELEENT